MPNYLRKIDHKSLDELISTKLNVDKLSDAFKTIKRIILEKLETTDEFDLFDSGNSNEKLPDWYLEKLGIYLNQLKTNPVSRLDQALLELVCRELRSELYSPKVYPLFPTEANFPIVSLECLGGTVSKDGKSTYSEFRGKSKDELLSKFRDDLVRGDFRLLATGDAYLVDDYENPNTNKLGKRLMKVRALLHKEIKESEEKEGIPTLYKNKPRRDYINFNIEEKHKIFTQNLTVYKTRKLKKVENMSWLAKEEKNQIRTITAPLLENINSLSLHSLRQYPWVNLPPVVDNSLNAEDILKSIFAYSKPKLAPRILSAPPYKNYETNLEKFTDIVANACDKLIKNRNNFYHPKVPITFPLPNNQWGYAFIDFHNKEIIIGEPYGYNVLKKEGEFKFKKRDDSAIDYSEALNEYLKIIHLKLAEAGLDPKKDFHHDSLPIRGKRPERYVVNALEQLTIQPKNVSYQNNPGLPNKLIRKNRNLIQRQSHLTYLNFRRDEQWGKIVDNHETNHHFSKGFAIIDDVIKNNSVPPGEQEKIASAIKKTLIFAYQSMIDFNKIYNAGSNNVQIAFKEVVKTCVNEAKQIVGPLPIESLKSFVKHFTDFLPELAKPYCLSTENRRSLEEEDLDEDEEQDLDDVVEEDVDEEEDELEEADNNRIKNRAVNFHAKIDDIEKKINKDKYNYSLSDDAMQDSHGEEYYVAEKNNDDTKKFKLYKHEIRTKNVEEDVFIAMLKSYKASTTKIPEIDTTNDAVANWIRACKKVYPDNFKYIKINNVAVASLERPRNTGLLGPQNNSSSNSSSSSNDTTYRP